MRIIVIRMEKRRLVEGRVWSRGGETIGLWNVGFVAQPSFICAASLQGCGWGATLTLGWSQGVAEKAAVFVTANGMSIGTGTPSLVVMSKGSVHVPVWSMSGGTVGQSIVGVATGLPVAWKAVKVELVVTTSEAESSSQFEDVYRVHLSQLVDGASSGARYYQGSPIRTRLPDEVFQTRNIVLDPFYAVEPGAPLVVRVQREPSDPAEWKGTAMRWKP
jgi:hypothetical protein